MLSVIHTITATICGALSYAGVMATFDTPDVQPAPFVHTLGRVAEVLMLPLFPVWSVIPLRFHSTFLEWSLMLANSCIWGFGLAYIIKRLSMRFSQPRLAVAELDR